MKIDNLVDQKASSALSTADIIATLNDFVRRGVLTEADGEYRFRLPIFERWLKQDGLAIVQPDPVSEELAASVQAEEDAAYVHSDEIVKLVSGWPTYQGRHLHTDDVRGWFEQVEGHRRQRLLFKLLTGLKFVSEPQLRDRAASAFLQLSKQLQEFVRRAISHRRSDVILTYLDGHGKSGEYITGVFAEENKIAVEQICSQSEVASRLKAAIARRKPISAVIIVDDIAATGRTLGSALAKFIEETAEVLREGDTKVLSCALYATKPGAQHIWGVLSTISEVQCDFRVGELLSSKASAFSSESELWFNEEERERAKALVIELGARVYRGQPLGFGGLGLLVVFPTTVPNNSLPILHTAAKSNQKSWKPLFPRPTN